MLTVEILLKSYWYHNIIVKITRAVTLALESTLIIGCLLNICQLSD